MYTDLVQQLNWTDLSQTGFNILSLWGYKRKYFSKQESKSQRISNSKAPVVLLKYCFQALNFILSILRQKLFIILKATGR